VQEARVCPRGLQKRRREGPCKGHFRGALTVHALQGGAFTRDFVRGPRERGPARARTERMRGPPSDRTLGPSEATERGAVPYRGPTVRGPVRRKGPCKGALRGTVASLARTLQRGLVSDRAGALTAKEARPSGLFKDLGKDLQGSLAPTSPCGIRYGIPCTHMGYRMNPTRRHCGKGCGVGGGRITVDTARVDPAPFLGRPATASA